MKKAYNNHKKQHISNMRRYKESVLTKSSKTQIPKIKLLGTSLRKILKIKTQMALLLK